MQPYVVECDLITDYSMIYGQAFLAIKICVEFHKVLQPFKPYSL